jgi:hypothetical protein
VLVQRELGVFEAGVAWVSVEPGNPQQHVVEVGVDEYPLHAGFGAQAGDEVGDESVGVHAELADLHVEHRRQRVGADHAPGPQLGTEMPDLGTDVGIAREGWSQPVSAFLLVRYSLRTSAGVRQLRVSRGRPLSSAAHARYLVGDFDAGRTVRRRGGRSRRRAGASPARDDG